MAQRAKPQGRIFLEVDFIHPLSPLPESILAATSGEGAVKTPMPGKIAQLHKQVGEEVKAGESIVVLEAMKMLHVVTAARAGVISKVFFGVDDVVSDGAILFMIDDVADIANGDRIDQISHAE